MIKFTYILFFNENERELKNAHECKNLTNEGLRVDAYFTEDNSVKFDIIDQKTNALKLKSITCCPYCKQNLYGLLGFYINLSYRIIDEEIDPITGEIVDLKHDLMINKENIASHIANEAYIEHKFRVKAKFENFGKIQAELHDKLLELKKMFPELDWEFLDD